jgi:hypothetical protein
MANPITLVQTSSRLLEQMEEQSGYQIKWLIERLSDLEVDSKENIELGLDAVYTEQRIAVICHVFGDFAKQIQQLATLLGRISVDQDTKTLTIIGSNNVLDF